MTCRPHRPSLARMQQAVDSWNANNRPGTKVIVCRDDGREEVRLTTSEAYVLSGHTAVIHFQGISGCFALDRIVDHADPAAPLHGEAT